MGLIDNKPRSATATAVGPTELDVITEDQFETDVLQHPARLRTYLGRLFERVRATDTLLELERGRSRAAAAPPVAAPGIAAFAQSGKRSGTGCQHDVRFAQSRHRTNNCC